jgi:hypothetical protein
VPHAVLEGAWFGVPLDSGVAVGLITRAQSPGAFGYFFGPRRDALPPFSELSEPSANDAILACRFTVGVLRSGEWPLLGVDPDWRRDDWPIPPLVRYDELLRRYVLMVYTDNLFEPTDQLELRPGDHPERFRTDDFLGEGVIPKRLSKLLGGHS